MSVGYSIRNELRQSAGLRVNRGSSEHPSMPGYDGAPASSQIVGARSVVRAVPAGVTPDFTSGG